MTLALLRGEDVDDAVDVPFDGAADGRDHDAGGSGPPVTHDSTDDTSEVPVIAYKPGPVADEPDVVEGDGDEDAWELTGRR